MDPDDFYRHFAALNKPPVCQPVRPTSQHLSDVRTAFLSVRQGLRLIHDMPATLLNLASLPVVPYRDGERVAGHIDVDEALALFKADIAMIEVRLQNHRAALSARGAV